jgi:tungstate transport system substrate-binding protein
MMPASFAAPACLAARAISRRLGVAVVLWLAAAIAGGPSASAAERYITLASTTSTENSGLFAHLLPMFSAATGIAVRVIAQGTGKAIETARRGDADVLLVHHAASERIFVAEGYGVERLPIMYNDFVLVGPRADPAAIRAEPDIAHALERVADSGATFVSRGDDSGTHKTERALWAATTVDVEAVSGSWYREAGAGMGAVLNLASALDAYTLSDRATWLAFQNQGELVILVEGDARLFNQYSVILVDPAVHPHVAAADGQVFVDWLRSATGQAAIDAYERGGEQLFFANYGKAS